MTIIEDNKCFSNGRTDEITQRTPLRKGTDVVDPDLFKHRAFTRAMENGVFFLSCNRSGTHGCYRFLGRSVVIAPDGKVLAESRTEEEEVIRAELDLEAIAAYRASTGVITDRRPDLYSEVTSCDLASRSDGPGLPTP